MVSLDARKIYGVHGLNYQTNEKNGDFTPVTCRLTCESWAVFCLGRIRKKSIEEGECHDGRRDGDWV